MDGWSVQDWKNSSLLWGLLDKLKVQLTSTLIVLRSKIFRWIVTAGHCHDSRYPLDVAVLGEHDLSIETETLIKIVCEIEIVLDRELFDKSYTFSDQEHCVQIETRRV